MAAIRHLKDCQEIRHSVAAAMVPVPELTPLATLVDSLGMLTSEPGTTRPGHYLAKDADVLITAAAGHAPPYQRKSFQQNLVSPPQSPSGSTHLPCEPAQRRGVLIWYITSSV
eukprot:jgi/Chrzof1/11548/UNPLg00484.t1